MPTARGLLPWLGMTCSITHLEWGAGIPAGGPLLYHQAVIIIPPPEQETRAETPGSLMTREELFLSNLAHIERVVSWVSARRGLRGADAEDFASIVKLRLVENEYEVLVKFEGRCSIRTYLTVVVNRMFLDFQDQRYGKWRSSAEARRLGPVAVRLERLVYRDGLTFDEAEGVLQTDERVATSREELHAIYVQLPRRPGRHANGGVSYEPSTMSDGPAALERAERQELARRTFAVIREVLEHLPAADHVFLRAHFERGLTVAEAARELGEDQKALYRRRDAFLEAARSAVEAKGIGQEDLERLLSCADWQEDLSPDDGESGPSGKDVVR
jgi:RNA polymerase sigma factor (sigma-70 family)